jgi:hypothetical protein
LGLGDPLLYARSGWSPGGDQPVEKHLMAVDSCPSAASFRSHVVRDLDASQQTQHGPAEPQSTPPGRIPVPAGRHGLTAPPLRLCSDCSCTVVRFNLFRAYPVRRHPGLGNSRESSGDRPATQRRMCGWRLRRQ